MHKIFFRSMASVLLCSVMLIAEETNRVDLNETESAWEIGKEQKVLWTNLAMSSAIIAWGFTQWDYGTEELHSGDEGWFGRETSNGGSDKLGHFYTNYLMTRILGPLFRAWGYSREDAALWAAVSSGIQSVVVMEVGDATSPEHGFSYEDALMDLLGSVIGYYWYRYPSVADKIDFRVEYWPGSDTRASTDFTTDYENMKHLMAVKAEGFDMFRRNWGRYFELQLGYYTRNFHHNSTPIEARERYLYAAIGVNLSALLRPVMGKYSGIFNFYQVPYTYLPYDYGLDK